MHMLGKSQLKICLSLLGGEMLRICPSVPSSDKEIRRRCEFLFRGELVIDRNPYGCEKISRSVSVPFFSQLEIVLSIQIRNETEDEDMDQDTPHYDRLHDHESESASGTENEESSGKSPYYRLQSESDLKRGEGR